MKKRLLSVLILATMLLTFALPIISASALIGPMYVNTSNKKGVNLRAAPSLDAEILTSIPYAASPSSYDYYNNTWAFVSYNGYYGYAMSRYFSSTKPGGVTPTPAPAPDLYTGFRPAYYYVTVRPSTPSGFVNLRWAPSKSQAVQGIYYAGQVLLVIAESSEWLQVYNETTHTCGFMMRSFLTIAGDGAVRQ